MSSHVITGNLPEILVDVVTFSHRHGMSDVSEPFKLCTPALPLNSFLEFLLVSSLPFHLPKLLIPPKLPEPTHLVDEVIQIFVLHKTFSRTKLNSLSDCSQCSKSFCAWWRLLPLLLEAFFPTYSSHSQRAYYILQVLIATWESFGGKTGGI